MATLAPSPRSTTITLASASAGPFFIGFPLFDEDGVHVFVDGQPRLDFVVSAQFSNGFDDDAAIMFTAPLVGGSTILIEGAMTPQREADYLSGDPGLTRKLNIELTRIWGTLSELTRSASQSLRTFAATPRFTIERGRVLVGGEDGGVTSGPLANDLVGAAEAAKAAALAADGSARDSDGSARAAAASAAAAAETENSLLEWKRGWQAGTQYGRSDIVSYMGSSWICITAHISAPADAPGSNAALWDVMAQKGTPGAGTGDMLGENNLADIFDANEALTNLGGTTVGKELFIAENQAAARLTLALGAAATRAVSADATLPAADGPELPTVGATREALATLRGEMEANARRRQMFGPFSTATGSEVIVSDIPAWANEIKLMALLVSASTLPGGNKDIKFRLGDSTGFYSAGYLCRDRDGEITDSMRFYGTSAADTRIGVLVLRRVTRAGGGVSWFLSGECSSRSGDSFSSIGGLSPVMAGNLNKIRFFPNVGTFDQGELWIEVIE